MCRQVPGTFGRGTPWIRMRCDRVCTRCNLSNHVSVAHNWCGRCKKNLVQTRPHRLSCTGVLVGTSRATDTQQVTFCTAVARADRREVQAMSSTMLCG